MAERPYGRILAGDEETIRRAYDAWAAQPVDEEIENGGGYPHQDHQTTLAAPVIVTGPGTYLGHAESTLSFEPGIEAGWWFDRRDVPESLPIHVSVGNVWTTVRNIVLCSGSPHNYMRMVEHIVALRLGLGLDNVVIRMDSGDPPLFDRSSLRLVEAIDKVGLVEQNGPPPYVSVREPVTVGGRNGSFLTFLPAEEGECRLHVDCAVDFRSAIGKQRIRFPLTPDTFRYGAEARTNTSLAAVLFVKTIGRIFADTRNLGYTLRNILVAGPRRYVNKPRLCRTGKSLEAVWHRATLDLLAAVGLIERGRFVGRIVSYKAGHSLDVTMIRKLYQHDFLQDV